MLASETEGFGPSIGGSTDSIEVAVEILSTDRRAPGLPVEDVEARAPHLGADVSERHAALLTLGPQEGSEHDNPCGTRCQSLAVGISYHKPKSAALSYASPMDGLPAQLRELRVKRGLTIRDLAPLIGVEFSTVASWERGRSEPPLSKLIAWSGALGAADSASIVSRNVSAFVVCRATVRLW